MEPDFCTLRMKVVLPLVLLLATAAAFPANAPSEGETNAGRIRRGLPPARPRKLYGASTADGEPPSAIDC